MGDSSAALPPRLVLKDQRLAHSSVSPPTVAERASLNGVSYIHHNMR